MKEKRAHVFKQTTHEVNRVKLVAKDIVKANELQRYISALKVVVFHDPHTVFLFMNFDQTLFISTKALEVCHSD